MFVYNRVINLSFVYITFNVYLRTIKKLCVLANVNTHIRIEYKKHLKNGMSEMPSIHSMLLSINYINFRMKFNGWIRLHLLIYSDDPVEDMNFELKIEWFLCEDSLASEKRCWKIGNGRQKVSETTVSIKHMIV